MKQALGFCLMGLLCLSMCDLFAAEAATVTPGTTQNFAPITSFTKPEKALQKIDGETRELIQSAFQREGQKPVGLLVQVVQNPYATAPSAKNADATNGTNNTTSGLNGFLANPAEAVNNLFSPNSPIGQVGVGLTVHF